VQDEANLAYVTQTTLSVDDARQIIAALKSRSPQLSARRRTTSATPRNRQDAVKALALEYVSSWLPAQQFQLESLREVAQNRCSRLWSTPLDLDPRWVLGAA
jgi:4-hydroxy-3-methylbut-2-enyl diphosphate reductase